MKRIGWLFAGLAVLASAPALSCSQEEAVAKMLKVTTALGEAGASGAIGAEAQVAANEKVNAAGLELGNGRYDAACALYDAVAAENGLKVE